LSSAHVEHGGFLDAAHGALEDVAARPLVGRVDAALPAALGILGDRVEPPRDRVGHRRRRAGSAATDGLSPPAIAACSTTERL
jgi:hypothetical protein